MTASCPPITNEFIGKLNELLAHGLPTGLGEPEPGKMCIMALLNYARGFEHGDKPECVADAPRRYNIRLNDSRYWSSPIARAQGLKRLAVCSLGTAENFDELKFATRLAIETTKQILPYAMRAAGLNDLADECATAVTLDDAIRISRKCQTAANQHYWSEEAAAAARAAAAAAAARAAAAAARAAAEAAAEAAAAEAAEAAAAAAARAAAEAAAAADEILCKAAEIGVQIMIEMETPGSKYLHLLK